MGIKTKMRITRNLLPLLLYVSLLSAGCLVSRSYARQGNAFRVFMKMKAARAIRDVNISYDFQTVLPDFNPELIPQEGSKVSDRISTLPGQPSDLNIGQYGGYITVNKTAGRALYYYFVEADSNKDTKPLILWFNGGPGCSSLGFGALEELGPLLVQKDRLIQNPYSWNKLGNILFLESPAGVGFSYSNTTSDYTSTGDKRTAQEAYTFLINWLERFPEYKNKDFYLTGESYAGHYVPQLAYTILQQNKKFRTIINLKGIAAFRCLDGKSYTLDRKEEATFDIAISSQLPHSQNPNPNNQNLNLGQDEVELLMAKIGNPGLHDIDDLGMQRMDDTLGYFEYLWRHNLISNKDWNTIQKSCDFTVPGRNRTYECQVAVIFNYLRVDDNLDAYNIYGPKCYTDNTTVTSGPFGTGDPCNHNDVTVYLNRPEVVKALHAKATRFDEGFPRRDGTIAGKWDKWEDCRQVLLETWQDSPHSILPILKHLITHGIRVLVFNGDLDAVIPYTSTRVSINRLELVEHKKWNLWGNKEISGSLVVYEGNLTLATVRGAGHEVPLSQPRRVFELVQSFLEGSRLPKAKTKEDLSELGIYQDDDD